MGCKESNQTNKSIVLGSSPLQTVQCKVCSLLLTVQYISVWLLLVLVYGLLQTVHPSIKKKK